MKKLAIFIVAFFMFQPTTYTWHYVPVEETEIMAEPARVTQVCNVSAYTSAADECGKDDGVTASGTKATAGRTIAADHLPFGTKVIVNGKEYIVEDRFGGGYSNRLDIYMETKAEAFEFGRREIEVEIVDDKG